MSDNKFDQKLADILNGLEAPAENGSWEAFLQKMDQNAAAEAAHEQRFDERIKAGLQQIDAPYQSAHWQLMETRIEQGIAVRRIRRHKLAEAAIVILIVANFQSFMDGGARIFHMPVPAPETPAQEVDMAQSPARSARKRPAPAQEAAASAENNIFMRALEALLPDAAGDAGDNNAATASAISASAPAAQGLTTADGRPIPAGLHPFALLSALGVNAVSSEQPRPMAAIRAVQYAGPGRTSAHTWVMANVNWNRHQVKEEPGYATQYSNAAAGLGIARRKGAWGIEAGVQYQSGQYATQTDVFELYRNGDAVYGTSWDQVQANVVSVPVKGTRRIAKGGKNSLHVTAGATGYLAAAKTYTHKTLQFPSLPQGQTLPSSPSLPAANGALEGGKWSENAYASADVGLRYERKVAPRLVAYIEPQYRRYAGGNGYGPKSARTNSFGLQAGVMAAL